MAIPSPEPMWRVGPLRLLGGTGAAAGLAIVVMALGIGAATSLFAVVRGVLLEPLPFPDADRLVMLWESNPEEGIERREVAPARFRDWQEQSTTLDAFAGFVGWSEMNLSGVGESEMVQVVPVTPNLLELLGGVPLLGRGFVDEDAAGDGRAVAILGHGLWRRKLGADPGVVGSTLSLHGVSHTIIGVMPEGFRLGGLLPLEATTGADSELWVPAGGVAWQARVYGFFRVIARLAPGVSVTEAQTELDAVALRLAASHASTDEGWRVLVVPLLDDLVGDYRSVLWLLFGGVGVLLVIAFANVASLLLARTAARDGEQAIRVALGASRRRLALDSLRESALLGALAGVIGMALAGWWIPAILALSPTPLPRGQQVGVDGVVLSFALLAALAGGVLSGLPAALAATAGNPLARLGSANARATGSRSPSRSALIVLQIALATSLLVGSGLLARSLTAVLAVDPGFDPEQTLSFRLDMPRASYAGGAERIVFLDRLAERLRALPGVEGVGFVNQAPLGKVSDSFRLWLPGRDYQTHVEIPTAEIRTVGGGFFETLRVPLLRGRGLATAAAGEEVVVNATMASRLWPGDEAIGQRLSLDGPEGPWRTVVGVSGDIRHFGLEERVEPEMFVPYRSIPWPSVVVVVRASGVQQLLPQVLRELRGLDPGQAVYDVATMKERLDRSLALRRLPLWLLGLFGVVALLLAAFGLYGLVSFSVARRGREIGIRFAVGALQRDVAWVVLRQGAGLALAGVLLGALISAVLARFLQSVLYEVSALDPLVYAVVPLLLVATAVVACLPPMWRAMRVSPLELLRSD